MLHVTRWSPDTCGCAILYEWDDEQPDEEREHRPVAEHEGPDGTLHRTEACKAHRRHVGHEALHAAVVAENQHKNRVIGAIAEAHGLDASSIQFSHDAQRRLRVALGDAVDADAKRALRAAHPDVTVV